MRDTHWTRKLNWPIIVLLTIMSSVNMALYIKLHRITSLGVSIFGLAVALFLLYVHITTGPRR